MTDFENQDSKQGFSMKLWRGERMCLLGFDVASPEPDFVGFAIESRAPGETGFLPLLNRIKFANGAPAPGSVTGARQFPSTGAPFQKFRWVHFPHEPKPGAYTYRATKMHMPSDGVLKKGTTIELDISLDPVTYHGFLDVGFTRNFASSQAFLDRFKNVANIDEVGKKIIPSSADAGLGFKKMPGDIYDWLGFEAYDLIFGFLDDAVKDPQVQLDVLAYDLNEPDILARLEKLGHRARAIIDDSAKTEDGVTTGHGATGSAESKSAKRLSVSAGKNNVKRTHFKGLQHHKVFIAKRNGVPFKVLAVEGVQRLVRADRQGQQRRAAERGEDEAQQEVALGLAQEQVDQQHGAGDREHVELGQRRDDVGGDDLHGAIRLPPAWRSSPARASAGPSCA